MYAKSGGQPVETKLVLIYSFNKDHDCNTFLIKNHDYSLVLTAKPSQQNRGPLPSLRAILPEILYLPQGFFLTNYNPLEARITAHTTQYWQTPSLFFDRLLPPSRRRRRYGLMEAPHAALGGRAPRRSAPVVACHYGWLPAGCRARPRLNREPPPPCAAVAPRPAHWCCARGRHEPLPPARRNQTLIFLQHF
jgi:hypothetical protein